ncbi:MAG: DUF4878 domain-containing protein [Saprospiraceae bacterium]|nr:DUF4878 domain-containing protein [Saprospiraceae bacterium]
MKKHYLLFVAIALVSFGLFSCGGSSSSPGDIVKKSFKYLESKDYAKVAGMYATKKGEVLSDEEQKKVEGMLGMAAQENEKKGGIKEIIIVEENISEDGETAKVEFTIAYKDESESTENADLIKIDGKWYMIIKM